VLMFMKNLFSVVRLLLALLVAAAPGLAGSVPTLDIEGRVADDETGASIPYVNVGVPGAGVGTVGAEDGRFALSGVQPDADVVFSAIGFAERTIAAEGIPEDGEVRLTRVGVVLREAVTVTAKEPGEPIVLGYQYESRGYGFGFGSGRLGAEIGAHIRVDRPTYVESANFTVAHTGGERFLYRVNIYEFSDGVVGPNLLERNVIVEAPQQRGTLTVDLRDHGLVIETDVLLSLEWIRDDREMGNANVMFRARPKTKANLYYKPTSQMPFRKVDRHRVGLFLLGHPLDR
jgi:hypothetical protein